MSVRGIGAELAPASTSAAAKFYLPGAGEFADTLNIGQIIQGRVLRSYSGSRYLVAFGQDERVVESSVPLTAGEVLRGRVVALGQHVELQRLYGAEHAPRPEGAGTTPSPAGAATEPSIGIDALLQRYRVELPAAERAALARAAQGAADPEAMALGGAMLRKLGLPVTPVLLEALYRAQTSSARPAQPPPELSRESTPQVSAATDAAAGGGQAAAVHAIAGLLARVLEAQGSEARAQNDPPAAQPQEAARTVVLPPSARRQPGDSAGATGGRREAQHTQLAEQLLNAQTGGIVVHRSGLLPLLVGGRLVEVSFALFEQRRPAEFTQLQHRQIIFSLRTEHLGQVEVQAHMSGTHVRLQVTTGSEESTARAAEHVETLRGALAESGWSVDEVLYATRFGGAHEAVARRVVEHVASLESLNRLI